MKTLVSGIALLLLAGCATLANTPAQERVYARFREVCHEKFPEYRLTRVYANGAFDAQPYGTNNSAFIVCMTGQSNWYPK